MMAELASTGPSDGRLRRERARSAAGSSAGKVLADEEMARRLHEELNGPELSPAAVTVKRNRKAPTFYTPLGPGVPAIQPEPTSLSPSEKGQQGKATEAGSPKSPFKQESLKAEKAGSSGKKQGSKARIPVYDSAENSPTARSRGRQKREAGAESAVAQPLIEEKNAYKLKEEPDESKSQSSRHASRDTRLRTKDSAQDFPSYALDNKGAQDSKGKAAETRTRVTRSSFAEPSEKAGDMAAMKTSHSRPADSEEVPTPRAALSTRLNSGSLNRASSVATSTRTSSQAGSRGKGKLPYPRIPKLPMCLHGNTWYRARKLGETSTKVNLGFPGVSGASDQWLPKDSQRIWTGSYKGKDWKHLGDGAWEPRLRAGSQSKRGGRGRKRRAQDASDSTSSGGDISELAHHSLDRGPARSAAGAAASSQPSSSDGDSAKSEALEEDLAEVPAQGKAGDIVQHAPASKRIKTEPVDVGEVERADIAMEQTAEASGPALDRKGQQSVHAAGLGTASSPSTLAAAPGKGRQSESRSPRQKRKAEHLDEAACGLDSLASAASQSAGPRTEGGSTGEGDIEAAQTVKQKQGGPELTHPQAVAPPVSDANPGTSAAPKLPASGLGELAIAMAGAKGMAQPSSRAEVQASSAAKSARNRKRAAARAARAAVDGEGNSPSETENGKSSSNTPPESPLSKLPLAPRAGDKPNSSGSEQAEQKDAWRGQWNEKHMQRLKELEEEEEAAENQDLPEDAQEPYPEQASERPMRAIRTPRLNAIDRPDGSGRLCREPDGSPQTPAKRAGRGRGRWANHIRKGTAGRGLKPLATASSQDTPRAGRGGGRGRKGGRWGNRLSKTDSTGEDSCLLAFGNLVDALDSRMYNSTLCAPLQDQHESCPTILSLSPDNFAGLLHREVKSFRMPPPPVPLFRVVI